MKMQPLFEKTDLTPSPALPGDGGGLALRGGRQQLPQQGEAAQHHELPGGEPL